MKKVFDRRTFVRDLTGVSGAVFTLGASGLLFQGCKSSGGSQTLEADDVKSKAKDAVGIAVRDSAANPLNNSLALYSRAIAAMKKTAFPRQINDENGRLIKTDWWEAHALIHMNYCPHGNWFFLPWHRAYLAYFERVIRQFCGDDSFALPYWDWSADGHLPPAFWSDAVLKHPLPTPNTRSYEERGIRESEFAPLDAVGKDTVDSIVATNDFFSFGGGRSAAPRSDDEGGTGQLEGLPHNTTHGWIGGDMGGFLSPRDPIFWMHHCNVDRLWSVWQTAQVAKGRSILPANPRASSPMKKFTADYWLAQPLGTFYNERSGEDVSMTVGETQDIASLGYSYTSGVTAAAMEDNPKGPKSMGLVDTAMDPTSQDAIVLVKAMEIDATAKTILFKIQRTQELRNILGRFKARMNLPAANVPNIRLVANHVPIPVHPESTRLEFYLMHGVDQRAERPTRIGAHAFFGHRHTNGEMMKKDVTVIFDLLEPLRKLAADGYDLARGNGTIQLLVHVVSDHPFPQAAKFDSITLNLEYDQYN